MLERGIRLSLLGRVRTDHNIETRMRIKAQCLAVLDILHEVDPATVLFELPNHTVVSPYPSGGVAQG
jgi:hypothetical protein